MSRRRRCSRRSRRTSQLSADVLFERGGRHGEAAETGDEPAVVAAIRADPKLTGRERQALLEIYTAFVARRRPGPGDPTR